MAMIICHECGHQISDTAEACPYCGAKGNLSSAKNSASSLDTLLNVILAAVGAFFTFVQLGTMYSDMNSFSHRYTYAPPLTAHETQVLVILVIALILCVSSSFKAIKNIYFYSTPSKNYPTIKPQTHTASHLCICPSCQAKNPAGSKFCIKCGTELQDFSNCSSKSDESGD